MISKLPKDCINIIFSLCDIETLLNLRISSKKLNSICDENIWKEKCQFLLEIPKSYFYEAKKQLNYKKMIDKYFEHKQKKSVIV